tara:strand:+ start:1348 stop:1725 length:378 start_codon:yes stop_codon:yes gene_type:complete
MHPSNRFTPRAPQAQHEPLLEAKAIVSMRRAALHQRTAPRAPAKREMLTQYATHELRDSTPPPYTNLNPVPPRSKRSACALVQNAVHCAPYNLDVSRLFQISSTLLLDCDAPCIPCLQLALPQTS